MVSGVDCGLGMRQRLKILVILFAMGLAVGCTDDGNGSSCIPKCDNMTCGSDGCGGSCGVCDLGTICYYGKCQSTSCIPNCETTPCVPACDPETEICQYGQCVRRVLCIPHCAGKTCGSDGCGGFCGVCAADQYCADTQCVPLEICTPDCNGKDCGDNGCGGSCGSCGDGQSCQDGKCTQSVCIPYCTGRSCGSNGCGGTCGYCTGKTTCDEASGLCVPWRVTGKLMLEQRTVYYDNYQLPKLDKLIEIPAYQIPLSLRDKNGSELGTAVVAEDGSFEILMDRLPISSDWIAVVPNWQVNGELKFGLVVASTNLPYLSWVWSIPLSKYGVNGQYGNIGTVVITEEEASGGLYIYQQIRAAYQDLIDYNIVTDLSALPSMAVAWSPGITWNCGTCYVNNMQTDIGKTRMRSTMYIGGGEGDESAWGYPTLLHEFGHYVLATLYKDSTEGGSHGLSTPCDPQLAWSEGFATFYALMMLSLRTGVPESQYWRVLKSGSYWVDYAHLYESSGFGSLVAPKPSLTSPKLMKQNLGEAWVTYMLYNFWDGYDIADPTVPGDDIYIGTEGIFNTLASPRYMKYYSYHDANRKTYGVDFVDFTDALVCGQDSDTFTTITDYIVENEFPYDLEPVCAP